MQLCTCTSTTFINQLMRIYENLRWRCIYLLFRWQIAVLHCIASAYWFFVFVYNHFGWTVNVGHPVDVSAKTATLHTPPALNMNNWSLNTVAYIHAHIHKVKRRIHCANGTCNFFFSSNRKDKMWKWRIFCTSANSFDSIRFDSIEID